MLTPLDIHDKEFKKALRGYDETEVDQFLDEVVRDYETMYRELSTLRDKVLSYEERIEQFQSMEESLKKTLVVAQDASEKLRANALHEAELIVREAEIKSGKTIDAAMNRAQQIIAEHDDIRRSATLLRSRIKSLLQAQIDLLDGPEWLDPGGVDLPEASAAKADPSAPEPVEA